MASSATDQDSGQQEDAYKVVERTNLLNMAKLAIKALIESAMKDGKVLDDSHPKLQQLCIVMEYIVDHRLKGITCKIFCIYRNRPILDQIFCMLFATYFQIC